MDEARIGQKGRLTHVWYQKGVRPRGVRQQGFASAHLFGAVCPERGEGVALVLPEVSTAAMGVFLAELSRAVPAGTHAALVLDGAGWHVSEDLTVPANLTLIHPPPYSPELNPVERVWEYLRDRWLSHRVLAGGYEAVVDAACAAWNALLAEPGRLRSLTSFPWLPRGHHFVSPVSHRSKRAAALTSHPELLPVCQASLLINLACSNRTSNSCAVATAWRHSVLSCLSKAATLDLSH